MTPCNLFKISRTIPKPPTLATDKKGPCNINAIHPALSALFMSAVADVFPWEVYRCSKSFATDWPVCSSTQRGRV